MFSKLTHLIMFRKMCSHNMIKSLLLTFLLVFFLCSCSSFPYILACLLLMFLLAVPSHRLIMNICCRLYISLNQISRHIIKQSEKVFLKVILRSLLADSFFAESTCIIFFTDLSHMLIFTAELT